MNQEIWRPIKNYPNHEVSNRGRVRVKARKVKTPQKHYRLVPEKILKPIQNGKYSRVSLSHNNNRQMARVDQLINTYFGNQHE